MLKIVYWIKNIHITDKYRPKKSFNSKFDLFMIKKTIIFKLVITIKHLQSS